MNLQRAMIMIASLSKIGSAKLHNRNKSTRKKGQQGASSARLDKLKHILRNKSAETSLSAADTSVRATSTDSSGPQPPITGSLNPSSPVSTRPANRLRNRSAPATVTAKSYQW